MSISVRTAGPDDVDELAAVAAATFPLACPPSTTAGAIADFIADNLTPAHFERHLVDPRRAVLVARDDEDRLFGYSMLVEGAPADAEVAAQLRIPQTVELSKFYLLPEHHGRGAAGLLMRVTLDVAAPFGRASGVWLGTNQENVRAQRFYEKHGFERVGVKRFLVGDRYEDDYVYERALPPVEPDRRIQLSGR